MIWKQKANQKVNIFKKVDVLLLWTNDFSSLLKKRVWGVFLLSSKTLLLYYSRMYFNNKSFHKHSALTGHFGAKSAPAEEKHPRCATSHFSHFGMTSANCTFILASTFYKNRSENSWYAWDDHKLFVTLHHKAVASLCNGWLASSHPGCQFCCWQHCFRVFWGRFQPWAVHVGTDAHFT